MKQLTFKGGELVPRRALEISDLVAPDNVEVITFKSLPAMQDFGRWYPETNLVLVNVYPLAQWAVDQVQESTNGLSFRAAMWLALLGTLAHEFAHAKQTNPESEAAEMEAQEIEKISPYLWAKHIDMELPLNWGGMIDEILAFEASLDQSSDHPWEITQLACLHQGLVWWDRNTGNCKFSFKQLAKDTLHDGDPKWDEILTPAPAGLDMIEPQIPAQKEMTAAVQQPAPPPPQPITPTPQTTLPEEQPAMAAPAPQMSPVQDDFDVPLYGDDDDVYDSSPVEPIYGQETITSSYPSAPKVAAPPAYSPPMTAAPVVPPTPAPMQTIARPVPTVSNQVKLAAMSEIMLRIHHHIYTKCGFAPGPTGTERAFHNAGMVTEPIYIGDIPGFREVLIGYDGVDGWGQSLVFNGKNRNEILERLSKGILSGTTSKAQGLPMYTLYVNIGGVMCKRLVMPANPNKKKPDGSWSKFAQEARMGVKRTMAMATQGDPKLPAGGTTSAVEEAPGGPATWRKW